MMQPFFMRTRATMMSRPTMNCRRNNGLSSSSSTVFQGMYLSSALARRLGMPCCRKALLSPPGARRVLPAVFLTLLFKLAVDGRARFDLGIAVLIPFVDTGRRVVQVSFRHCKRPGFTYFPH